MRLPIKLNESRLPDWMHPWLPTRGDPRGIFESQLGIDTFENAISAIRIDTTWKSTCKGRHELTDEYIASIAECDPAQSILEIGASSGATSLDLINRLGLAFEKYYVTDIYFSIYHVTIDGVTYFFHPRTKKCIMRATDWCIVYEDFADGLPAISTLARRLMHGAPAFDPALAACASMLHPELRRRSEGDSRIHFKEYNVFDDWNGDPLSIIKVANVLNRAYFSDDTIAKAVANLNAKLLVGGRLIVTDNRNVEMVTVFSRTASGALIVEKEINGGCNIRDIILDRAS